MEVSRIEAISPKQIDWRKLTSKEIIKYDALGVEVPSEYLQWAREFWADIEATDKDETTYEMAHTTDTTTQSQTSTAQSAESDDAETNESSTEIENPEDNIEKTAAQTKREELEDSGASLRTQALIFTKDSKNASKETLISNLIMAATEDKSDNEIQKLEMYMKIILAQAESAQNELKAEIDKINNDSNNSYSLNKINKLEKQLERYGTQAQTTLAGEETQFNEFDATILAQSGKILNAADFGSETSIIGNELLSSTHRRGLLWWLIDHVIGKNAVKVGDRTVDAAKAAAENQSEALNTNSGNLGKVQDFKTEVENKTGIAAAPQAKENDNQDSENNNEDSTSTEQNSTESDKAASANIDEILKAKIRKGEGANESST